MKIEDQTTQAFIEALASRAATPGGGAATALTAAQGAALLSMVANISKSESVDFSKIANRTSGMAKELLHYANDDAKMFEEVMRCLKLPKSDASRAAALEQALLGAAGVPMRVIERCIELLTDACTYIPYANPNVISDAGIAVHFLQSAIHASAYTVRINLKYLKNTEAKTGLDERLSVAEQGLPRTVATALAAVDTLMN